MDCPLFAAGLALLPTTIAFAQQPRLAVLASPGEPLRVVVDSPAGSEPVIESVSYEAAFEDQTLAFRIESVRSVEQVAGGRRIDFALSGPAAGQTQVEALVTEVPRGVRMRWTLRYAGEPRGFFPWTAGLRWAFASPIQSASGVPTTRWVEPTGAHDWEVLGDAPYPDFECHVRTVRLADRPPIAFVTEWYDPDWIYGGAPQRAAFMKAVPNRDPGETTFTFALLQAEQASAEDLAAIEQGHPLSLALGDRRDSGLRTPGASTEVLLRVANVTAEPVAAHLWWDVHDYYGNAATTRTGTDLNLAPGEDRDRPLVVQYDRQGVLFIRVALESGEWRRQQWRTLAFLPDRAADGADPSSPFGLAALIANPATYPEHFDLDRVATLAERIGVRWLRACPFPVKAEVSSEEEQFAREQLETLRRHGLLLHVQLGHELTQQPDWQNTLRATLDRFGGAGAHWEFGNELNPHIDPAEQRAAARAYCDESLRPFHAMLRAASPEAAVMPHGVGGIEAAYLDGWGESGAWDLLDVLSVHPGSFPRAPEWDQPGEFWSLIPQLRTLKGAFAKYGDKPYWVTEIYAPTPPSKYGLDLRTSAEYLIRTYMVCLEWGAQVVEWYQFQDGVWFAPIPKPTDVEHNFGLLYSDLSPKPAYVAYATMTSRLAGLRFLGRRDLGDPDLYAYAFGAASVPAVHVMWSYREKHELDGSWAEIGARSRRPAMPWENRWTQFADLRLPAPGPVTVTDIMGNTLEVAAADGQARLILSGSPIFVRGLAELPASP
ncbi:MAG: hypothetical protein FJX74_12340 [Armatimonadetes bacterium]|nr:hypothetical protein [Armatimonadota bacterium]